MEHFKLINNNSETSEQIINEFVHLPNFIEEVMNEESWIINSQEFFKTAFELEKNLRIL